MFKNTIVKVRKFAEKAVCCPVESGLDMRRADCSL